MLTNHQAYTMDANEAQEEYEEVQCELRKKEEEVRHFMRIALNVNIDWMRNLLTS